MRARWGVSTLTWAAAVHNKQAKALPYLPTWQCRLGRGPVLERFRAGEGTSPCIRDRARLPPAPSSLLRGEGGRQMWHGSSLTSPS